MADKTFHHLAIECSSTLGACQEFFEGKDILVNIVNDLLDFSYPDQINPILDRNNVHEIHLTDTESEGKEDET